jgi:F-type H+-transporting ATPase subunit gamma
MAVGKEIRTKITSVKNTRKITKAMELVAASKMRKAQTRMASSRPYATKMLEVISHLANSHPEYRHPYLQDRDAKRIGLIVVSSDRGLCAGLNSYLFKKIVLHAKTWEAENLAIDYCLLGSKAAGFFKRLSRNIVATASHLGDEPSLSNVIGLVNTMLTAYDEGRIDRLYVCYNRFVNTMKQEPVIQQLLPIIPAELSSQQHYWDYLYEPDSKVLLDVLLKRYIETQVYQAVVENIASEQASRMVAMKNATENAGQIIEDLKLIYNKARQAAITREIAEIVSGADAV